MIREFRLFCKFLKKKTTMSFLDKIREHPVSTTTVVTVRKVYAWATENLWPVYSAGVIVSAMCMLAACQEKQTLADHLYGNNKTFQSDRSDIVGHAGKQMDEEISYAIKHDVFAMSKSAFEAEHEARR